MSGNTIIAKNTIMLFIRMALIMIVTLYTSRVLLQVIGIENFGIFNAVGSIAFIFNSISSSMNAASSRFLICEFGKKNDESMKKVFNAIFFLHLIVGVFIFFVIEIVGLYLFDTKMVIPVERLNAAKWVFHFSAFSVVFLFMSYPFNSLIIAHEKMGAFAAISVVEALLRLGIVYLVSLCPLDKLFSYGLFFLTVQIIIQLFYVMYCKVNFQETCFFFSIDKKLWYDMVRFMGWIFVGNAAYVGYTQGLNLLLNMFFGPVVNASRAIAVQVQNAVTRFSDNFQTAIRPQITISFVQKDTKQLGRLIELGSRISFFLMSLILYPLLFNVDAVLKIWLQEVPPNAAIFIILLMGVSILRCLGNPLIYAIQANGNIRKVQIMEGLSLVMVLPISYIALKIFHVSAEIVFVITLFAELCAYIGKIFVVIPKIGLNISCYLKNVIFPISFFSMIALLFSWLLCCYVDEHMFWERILSVGISLIVFIVVMYWVLLNSNERKFFLKFLKKVFVKKV